MELHHEEHIEPPVRWTTFRLGEERYGINVMSVKEVLRYIEITPVPGTPQFVIGIINLRGNVVTVIDTRILFSLPLEDITDKARIVIVEAHDQTIGLLVEAVEEVANISQDDIENPPNVGNEQNSRYFQGVTSTPTGLIILVELDQMVQDVMDKTSHLR